MVNDGNHGNLASDHSLVKRGGSSKQNNTSYHLQTGQIIEGEKNFMETEGRAFSDFYRNSSEELYLKALMESPVAMPVPNMEMLGFKNFQNFQSFRTDSEELFKSWLTNGDQSSSNIAHRTRQASRRISTELSTQQQGNLLQKRKSTDVLFSQNNFSTDEISGDLNQNSIRTAVDRGMQGNLLLAKAWFQSSQPMTRSRSSELRRRYVAMQTAQTTPSIEALLGASGNDISRLKQEFPSPNGFSNFPVSEIPNQFGNFMSPPNNSPLPPFYTVQNGNADKVSSVVSMLKGTLERKKLGNQVEKETFEGSSNGLFHAPEHMVNFSQGQLNPIHEVAEASPGAVQIQGSIDLDLDGLVNHTNTIMSTVSRETSQSESSAAAPVVSSNFDMCDGPSNSSQTFSACETSMVQAGNGKNTENGSKPKDFRERIIDNLKDDRKRGLVRYGSISSNNSVDKADPTKKRRVERSRKMAEAKERSSTPTIPSDMQAILKRCENLEKEVRSLKLNLAFMNRKDSEQTKQIEELQIQNEALSEEKERLLEEIERILGDTGRM